MGKTSGVVGALRALGGGAVVVKDAFWGSLEVLGAAVDAAKKAPEAARTAVEDGKAAIEGGFGVVYRAVPTYMGQFVNQCPTQVVLLFRNTAVYDRQCVLASERMPCFFSLFSSGFWSKWLNYPRLFFTLFLMLRK